MKDQIFNNTMTNLKDQRFNQTSHKKRYQNNKTCEDRLYDKSESINRKRVDTESTFNKTGNSYYNLKLGDSHVIPQHKSLQTKKFTQNAFIMNKNIKNNPFYPTLSSNNFFIEDCSPRQKKISYETKTDSDNLTLQNNLINNMNQLKKTVFNRVSENLVTSESNTNKMQSALIKGLLTDNLSDKKEFISTGFLKNNPNFLEENSDFTQYTKKAGQKFSSNSKFVVKLGKDQILLTCSRMNFHTARRP